MLSAPLIGKPARLVIGCSELLVELSNVVADEFLLPINSPDATAKKPTRSAKAPAPALTNIVVSPSSGLAVSNH